MGLETKNHIIKNFKTLATSSLRRQALLIIEEGYKAIDTRQAIFKAVQFDAGKNRLKVFKDTYDLAKYKKIICIGFGKASKQAALALREILGRRISKGYFIGLEEIDNLGPDFIQRHPKISQQSSGDKRPLNNFWTKSDSPWEGAGFICRVGTHPLPSRKNLEYTKEMVACLEGLSEDDLVICVVSGGGSALLCAPYGQSVEQEAEVFKALTAKGANIQELNIVRKHTSLLKGGQLAKFIFPATCIGLIFSDVPGNDMSVVAGGPTVRDSSAARDALKIAEKYDLLKELNRPKLDLVETPKEEGIFKNIKNYLVVSSQFALLAMREKAEEFGHGVEIFSDHFQGEAKEIGRQIPTWLFKKGCLLGAGESTVRIEGQGKGGRNMEMALAALELMPENSVFIAAASDGRDNTEAAGAIVDVSTFLRAGHLGVHPKDFLANNDSFSFFEKTGDLLLTGLTGSNVSDFFVFLKN
jgi:glycerate 2-kinase